MISTMMRTVRIFPTGVDWVKPAAAWAAGGRTLNGCGVGELEAQAVLAAATVSVGVGVGDLDAVGDVEAVADVEAAGVAVQVAVAAAPVGVVPPALVVPSPVVFPPVVCCELPLDDPPGLAEEVGRPDGDPALRASVCSLVTTDRAWACRLELSGR